ncbi:MAG: arginine--tRNA ligase [Deltaproteobacteria bacterium]|nr:arginine--tRNA ligase [Deltaproteobacteria bacterium]
MKQRIKNALEESLKSTVANPEKYLGFVDISETKDKQYGDYSTNIALVLAKELRMSPRQVADSLREKITTGTIIKKVEVAGPGFVNFFVNEVAWGFCLQEIFVSGDAYGKCALGKGKKVQVEFVSANPTGPLHIGHARGAVVGDVIARLLSACGYEVVKEYYINDTGNQMSNLGISTLYRCRELKGDKSPLPDNSYQGEYLLDVAQEILEKYPDILQKPEKEATALCGTFAATVILNGIVDDLAVLGVNFDRYFSESSLYETGLVTETLTFLEQNGTAYRTQDGTLWFRTSAFGDEKDRVIVRATGAPTYFAADIAYHHQKFSDNYDRVIDIWGADHHGYIARMRAGVEAMGHDVKKLDIVLIQLVALLRNGIPVAMSTRAGEFVTLREVVEEVGADAARYNFLLRRLDSHLDFDLEIAKRQSSDNPVYYVQYAHARACSVLRLAEEKKIDNLKWHESIPSFLTLEEEIAIIRLLISFPDVVRSSAQSVEPHRLAFFLNELASMFHSYYNKYKIISDDEETTLSRLFLVGAIKTVIKNGLTILGVSAPQRM